MLHDKDIREPLFEFLEETYGKVRIIEEKVIGKSRADVVMVLPDAVCGIEIKSDADTYARLAGQVKDYDRYYDRNFVAVGTSHAVHIAEHVPSYWGIITVEEADGTADFYILRKPSDNPKMKPERKLQILWRPELAALQEHFGMPKYKEKSKDFVIGKILERIENGKIPAGDFRREMSECLFERDYTTVKEDLAKYRRSEIEKRLEHETDPEVRIELMAKKSAAKANLHPRKRRRRRRRII